MTNSNVSSFPRIPVDSLQINKLFSFYEQTHKNNAFASVWFDSFALKKNKKQHYA